ncbi:MAG: hypothetical protein Q8R53_03740 [Nanoarchaeota archaeon]|nr:hypothetical protein [Nanoarchaeota archaeon]
MTAYSRVERLALWCKPRHYELFSEDADGERQETFYCQDIALEQALKHSDSGKRVALYSVHELPGLREYGKVRKPLLRTEERMMKYTQEHLDWKVTGDPTEPYQTEVRGTVLRVRLNDFPDESLYMLLVNGTEVQTLEEWPSTWKKEQLPYMPGKVASPEEMQTMAEKIAANDTEDGFSPQNFK